MEEVVQEEVVSQVSVPLFKKGRRTCKKSLKEFGFKFPEDISFNEKQRVVIGGFIGFTPGGRYGYFDSNVGVIKKPMAVHHIRINGRKIRRVKPVEKPKKANLWQRFVSWFKGLLGKKKG